MKILLVAYDNDSYMTTFPSGIAYIAAYLLKDGHQVEIYNQDIHHYPDEHLTDFLNKNIFDVIGVGVVGGYYQYRKLLSISKAINASKNRPFFILGGHGPSPEPKYFLKKTQADAVVIGEGEIVVSNLLKALENNNPLRLIKGIAFRKDNDYVVNERETAIDDIDGIPMPAYDLFPMDIYRLRRAPHAAPSDFAMSLIAGRGCSYQCNFCYRLYKGLKLRSVDSVIEEIKLLREKYGVNYLLFYDELTMSSEKRIIDLSEAILNCGHKFKWYCNGRLNIVTPEAISLMKKAGCVYINYGIECFDDVILKNMNKHLTTDQIVRGIETTLNGGITPGLNVIFGNIGENLETMDKSLKFLLKYNDYAEMRTIRPVTPYPGTPLYYYAIEKGLLKDVEDFYENKHVNSDLISVNFTTLTDREFHEGLYKANKILIDKYFEHQKGVYLKQSSDLYRGVNVCFRGYRQS